MCLGKETHRIEGELEREVDWKRYQSISSLVKNVIPIGVIKKIQRLQAHGLILFLTKFIIIRIHNSMVLKSWCFQICCWRRLLRVPGTASRSKQVNPKGNQSWICIGRTDAEAEVPILWPPDVKRWLTEKDPDAGRDWWQEEKGATEDEMVGWYHWLNGHESEEPLGDSEGQASCSPWGRKQSDWCLWTVN